MHIHAPNAVIVCAFRALTCERRRRKVQCKMRWKHGHGALVGILLLAGCGDGGQTGQPTATSGCWKPVALDAAIEGVTGQQLLDTFIGKYSATLHWQDDIGMPPDEEITIEIAAAQNGVAQEASSYPCWRLLTVPVQGSLTFADGSVFSGSVPLGAPYGTFDASLSFSGMQRIASATLRRSTEGITIEGKVEPDGDGSFTGVFSGAKVAAGSGNQ